MTVGVNFASNATSGTFPSSYTQYSQATPASGNVAAIFMCYSDSQNGRMCDTVDYNGTALTYIGTAIGNRSNEDGEVEIWFGSWASFPQGTNNLGITPNSGAAGASWNYDFLTLSGSGICVLDEPYARRLVNSSTANPTIAYPAINRSAMIFACTFSGLASPNNLTPLTNCTGLNGTVDFGQQSALGVRQTTAGSGAFNIGWTASADDIAMLAIRVTDAPLNQDTWRWRNDDGNETSATWMAAAGANPSSITVTSNTKKRLRFALSDVQAYNNVQPALECGWSRPLSGEVTQLSYGTSQSADLTIGATVGGIAVAGDGSFVYHTDNLNDRCYGHPMTTGYDLTTCTASSSYWLSYGSQEGIGTNCSGSSDGSKIYVGGNNRVVYQYALTTNYDPSSGSYDSKSLDTSTQCAGLNDHGWCLNGTRVFVYSYLDSSIFQYNISTAWDLSTGSYASKSLNIENVGEQVGNSSQIGVSQDGTYLVWNQAIGGNILHFFIMTTPGELDTAYYAGSFTLSNSENKSAGAYSDGRYVFALSTSDDIVRRLDFASGFRYTPVTTTSEKARAADSSNVTHAADTTQQISSGTFITPNSGISETGVAGTDNDMDLTAGSKCEAEYVIEFVEADLVQDEELRFRIANADTRSDI